MKVFPGPRGRPDLKNAPKKPGQTAFRYPDCMIVTIVWLGPSMSLRFCLALRETGVAKFCELRGAAAPRGKAVNRRGPIGH